MPSEHRGAVGTCLHIPSCMDLLVERGEGLRFSHLNSTKKTNKPTKTSLDHIPPHILKPLKRAVCTSLCPEVLLASWTFLTAQRALQFMLSIHKHTHSHHSDAHTLMHFHAHMLMGRWLWNQTWI